MTQRTMQGEEMSHAAPICEYYCIQTSRCLPCYLLSISRAVLLLHFAGQF
jgi:hypothetical protein